MVKWSERVADSITSLAENDEDEVMVKARITRLWLPPDLESRHSHFGWFYHSVRIMISVAAIFFSPRCTAAVHHRRCRSLLFVLYSHHSHRTLSKISSEPKTPSSASVAAKPFTRSLLKGFQASSSHRKVPNPTTTLK